MLTPELSLDDLYREAKAAMRAQIAKEAKSPKAPTPIVPDEYGLYRNPDNWTRGAPTMLIHEESGALLGYLVEWKHKTVPCCRRLVRGELAHASTHAKVEYLSGSFPEAALPAIHHKPWKTQLSCLSDVTLLDFSLSACEVPLECFFGEGDLVRVELVIDTAFASQGQILILPAETNILPRLSPAQVQHILTLIGQ